MRGVVGIIALGVVQVVAVVGLSGHPAAAVQVDVTVTGLSPSGAGGASGATVTLEVLEPDATSGNVGVLKAGIKTAK